MGPLDAFWHLINFFAPAVGVGLLSASLAKLVWRRALAGVGWRRLAAWACAGATVALVGGAVVLGRDGRMATYLAMVLATALALGWAGFGPRRRA
ncbi:hypothetical protein [Caldimonas thermodepolymerans]|jgi:hypothetical protein|uniref:Uncharacterized protein n=1 Tax=Caldimonas thermodepolymerans TaxID=215580 RepID=A0AA46DFM6_9BURK|nr:hypothetical protein [Caldimonas thermodepolymerans]TCP07998.1 hypothetical protein EV676_10328 [Caldimonas thermodepolymerans]UZG45129.1 hypothetical protein ONZ46_04035 [Caldimonas thermodepolymerans]UZG48876.1 hypothetical protein ONS87_04445 [Caldimonas thermodepolymerans]